ncbi:PQQ-binding-like beta-propeller repeat protein [Actinomadura welshii]
MRTPIALPRSTRARALTAGAVLVAVAAVLALVRACDSGGPALDPLPGGERRPRPVSFSGEPMWDGRKLGMVDVDGVELRGDVAVVTGDAGLDARLAVADIRTGRPHWVLDAGAPLKGGGEDRDLGFWADEERAVVGRPLVYGSGDDWAVLVHYAEGSRGKETEIGVAALSGKDGTVRWRHALIRPRAGAKGGEDRKQKVRLLAANERLVLTSVEGERGSDPKTVALDPATGEPLWESKAGWAFRFAGDLVLGETEGEQAPADPAEPWKRVRSGAGVFALDAKTGDERWNLSGSFESSHLEAVAGGTAVANVREKKPGQTYTDDRTVLLDAATGREAAGSGAAEGERFWGCADDGRTLIACAASGGRLVTLRPGAGEEPFTTRKLLFDAESPARVGRVWRDLVFAHAPSSGDRPVRRAVVDRAGNRTGPAPRGDVAAISERAVAFLIDRKESPSGGGLAVHAASAGTEAPEPGGPGRPALQPPGIEKTPLWTAMTSAASASGAAPAVAKDTGLASVLGIRPAGDALVLTGQDADDRTRDKQVVVDMASGKVRWSVRKDASLGGGAKATFIGVDRFLEKSAPLVADLGDEWLTFIEYRGPGNVQGIAALSLKDGSVRWKKRTTSGNGYSALEAVDERTVAVRVSNRGAAADETVVYAAATGKELWRERGVRPRSTGGGLVLAAEYAPGGPPRKPRDLIAYGAPDGERRWRLGDRYAEPELLHDAGGGTVVIGTADGGAVLDRATGRELARTRVPLDRCDGDADTLIVCRARPETAGARSATRAVTIQTRDGATKIQDLLETGFLDRYRAVGNWFAAHRPETTGQDARPERFLLLDGDGRVLSDDLPGELVALDGGFAVLAPAEVDHRFGGGVAVFTVHRVR